MKICENCKNEHDGFYGSGRFCSEKCSKSFSTKEKRKLINKKVSKKLKNKTSHRLGVKLSEEHKLKIAKKRRLIYQKRIEDIKQNLPFETWPKHLIKKTIFNKFGNVCSECQFTYVDKNGKGPFEIHHKDGNHDNWKEKNLDVLCLNCHWKTPNWRFRGKHHTEKTKNQISLTMRKL